MISSCLIFMRRTGEKKELDKKADIVGNGSNKRWNRVDLVFVKTPCSDRIRLRTETPMSIYIYIYIYKIR